MLSISTNLIQDKGFSEAGVKWAQKHPMTECPSCWGRLCDMDCLLGRCLDLCLRGQAWKLAAINRTAVMALVLLSNSILPDYDMSAAPELARVPEVQQCHGHIRQMEEPSWPWLAAGLESLVTWDAVYLVRIAQCGYEYEQFHAFFPGYPAAMWLASQTIFRPLQPLCGERATLGLAGLLISNVSFVIAAQVMYRLSLAVLRSSELSAIAAMLFCFNPACVFCSMVYTESLYSLAALSGMLACETGPLWLRVTLFALSTSIRSNGVVNLGFILHDATRRLVNTRSSGRKGCWLPLGSVLAGLIVSSLGVVSPLLAFQYLGYLTYCLRAGAELPAWCLDAVPNLYAHVQSRYWGVGLLKYFEPKQVPNFLLAAPVLVLSAGAFWCYVSSDWERAFRLGVFKQCPRVNNGGGSRDGSDRPIGNSFRKTSSEAAEKAFQRDSVLVYVFHLAALALVAFLAMHVQVSTRFLSSASPAIYWYAAHLWVNKRLRRSLVLCCLAFGAAGIILHVNFLPWT